MKQHKRFAQLLLAAVLLSVFILPPLQTEAGRSEITLDAEMLTDSNWSDPEGDIEVTDEKTLIFSKDSSEYTRYITRSTVKADKRFDTMVELSASMKFTQMPSGKSFILGFGLGSIEAVQGEAKNVEVTFTNNGGIKVGITAYDENGTAHTVVKQKASGISLNKAVTVKVEVRTDKRIIVSVNNTVVCSGTLPVSGEGRFGFLQTGNCGAEIANLVIKQYAYDTPENTNVSEDFEQGAIDLSKLAARTIDMFSVFPRGQWVDKYNDNYVMMFKNTQRAYIGTVYKYSNFELTFDVPYMNIETEWEDGVRTKIGQQNFYISFGGEQAEWKTEGWKTAVETVVYNAKQVYSFNNKKEINAELTKDPWAENGRPFSIKVAVVDSVVTVGIKWLEEKSFDTVLTYQLKSGTPTGHIHIWVPGEGNCAVDNIKITNLDEDAKIIETEFKSGKMVIPEDYAYEPMERIYADSVQETDTEQDTEQTVIQTIQDMLSQKPNLWYLLIPAATVLGAIAITTTALIVRKKKKEVTQDA